jgi:Protein of unknown function (DUF3617)
MRALVKLAIFGILVFWIGPTAWNRLSPSDQVQIINIVNNLRAEANNLLHDVGQGTLDLPSTRNDGGPPRYLPTEGTTTLMQPGLWSFDTTETIGGQTMTGSATQCVTPEKVAQMTTGNGFVTGTKCQVQGGRQGRQVSASGQCVIGNMSMQVTVQMTFDTPQHVHGQMSGGAGGAQGFAATVDGRWVGGC